MQGQINIMEAKLSRNATLNQRFLNEIRDLRTHSMKENIIFTFDKHSDYGKEISGENCEGLVRYFLSQTMRVPGAEHFYIPVAHRLGRYVRGKNALS